MRIAASTGDTAKSLEVPAIVSVSSTTPKCFCHFSFRGCFATQYLAAYSSRCSSIYSRNEDL